MGHGDSFSDLFGSRFMAMLLSRTLFTKISGVAIALEHLN